MYYVKPAHGPITSFMDRGRKHPVIGEIRPHQGIDIGYSNDNRVWAAASGIAYNIGYGRDVGNFVLIQHANGQCTSYSHLSSVSIKQGERVTQGQTIGIKGATGKLVTGVHLHFEISKERWTNSFNNKLNPLLLFVDPEIKEIQGVLQDLGYDVEIDGIYGEKTITAVALYQKRNGLQVDGKAGRGTYAKLKSEVVKKMAAVDEKKTNNTITLNFTSGTLRSAVETFEGSKLQQEMAAKFAVASGLDQSWIDKQKDGTATNGDLLGLLLVAAIKMLKENQ